MLAPNYAAAAAAQISNEWIQKPVFCLFLGVSSNYAQPITGQVTEVTYPVIDQA